MSHPTGSSQRESFANSTARGYHASCAGRESKLTQSWTPSGESHSVREFIEKSFAVVGMSIKWSGTGVDEVGTDVGSGKVVVRIDPRYFRYIVQPIPKPSPYGPHTYLSKLSVSELIELR